jgi:RNA polymerase sigma-70 factor, ECF subfamily
MGLVVAGARIVPPLLRRRGLSRSRVTWRGVDALTRLAMGARSGDGGAFDRFVEAGYQDVWRFCASLVDAAAADDLCQETFTRAVQALPRFRGCSSARTWLLAIARNICADELRRRARQRQREGPMPLWAGDRPRHGATTAMAGVRDGSLSQDDHSGRIGLSDLVRQLGPDQQLAFVLTQVVGLSYKEAATVCQCPIGTVRSRVARARSELLSALGRTGEYSDRRLGRNSPRGEEDGPARRASP